MNKNIFAPLVFSMATLLTACDASPNYETINTPDSQEEPVHHQGQNEAEPSQDSTSSQQPTQTQDVTLEKQNTEDSITIEIKNPDSQGGSVNTQDSNELDTNQDDTDIQNNESNGAAISNKDTGTPLSFSKVHTQIIQTKCVACHTDSGIAGATKLVFARGESEMEFNNKCVLDNYLFSNPSNGQTIKDKVRGLSQHGGGSVLAYSSSQYTLWSEYIDGITQPQNGTDEQTQQEMPNDNQAKNYTLESPAATYRRASLILTAQIPSAEKLQEVDTFNEPELKDALYSLMQGQSFHEFIKTSANDQLLVRRLVANAYREIGQGLEKHYSEYKGIAKDNDKRDELANELEEEPLELIAYVIENDRPYSEILTANYTLASIKSARLFKAAEQSDPTFKPVQNLGQSLIMGRFTDFDADSLTQIPHAGLLTSYAYLNKYPTTATNRNRARASATLKHFLGFDIEDSSAREISNDALSDSENPTMSNPACTVCHQTLDPIAGAFQNFGGQGIFRDRRYGMDSLDAQYAEYDKDSEYQSGDTWYRDMREPGFYNDISQDNSNSLNWLAHQLVKDDRFATGTVKFWWPAIFGEELLSASSERHQFDAQASLIESLATDFREHLSLKTLIVNMLTSDYFRAAKKSSSEINSASLNINGGGSRLLTPEQLQAKIQSLSGFIWKEERPHLTNDYNIYYGGIDSNEVEQRARSISNVMARVAEKSALSSSCAIVATEFNKTKSNRQLFTEVERDQAPGNYHSATLELPAEDASGMQSIHYSMDVAAGKVKIRMQKPTKQVFWQSLRITDAKQNLIIEGDMAELVAQTDWITGSGGPARSLTTGEKSAYYLCCSSRYFEMEIPVEHDGQLSIEMQMWADNDNTSIDVTIEQSEANTILKDSHSQLVKQQLVVLFERLLNEKHTINAPEIELAFGLFTQLRAAKIARGSHSDMKESNIDCLYYDDQGVSESVWAKDTFHTLTAWRGVLAALMMDPAFIYE